MSSSDSGLDQAARQAREAIEANQVDELRQLISEHPGLLTWRDLESDGKVLLQATTSYANFPGADNEDLWTRRACAELLLDAGALVDPRVPLRLINTGAHGMLELFAARGALPLNFRANGTGPVPASQGNRRDHQGSSFRGDRRRVGAICRTRGDRRAPRGCREIKTSQDQGAFCNTTR